MKQTHKLKIITGDITVTMGQVENKFKEELEEATWKAMDHVEDAAEATVKELLARQWEPHVKTVEKETIGEDAAEVQELLDSLMDGWGQWHLSCKEQWHHNKAHIKARPMGHSIEEAARQ